MISSAGSIRKIVLYLSTVIAISLYGIKVCPFLESLSFDEVISPVFIVILFQWMFSQFVIMPWILKSGYQTQINRIYFTELLLFVAAGVILTAYNTLRYQFPVESGLKVLIGLLLAGFFVSLDLALSREFEMFVLFKRTGERIERIHFKISFSGKLIVFVATCAFLILIVFFLLLKKDIDWLSKVSGLVPFGEAQNSILKDFIYVAMFSVFHIINLLLSFSRNLKAYFKTVNHALKEASENRFDSFVPVSSNNEFGFLAMKSNEMIHRLKEHENELNQIIENLRKSEKNLAKSQEIAQLGNWVWHVKSNQLEWSDEIFRIFGFSPQEFKPSYEIFSSMIHPDDREKVHKATEKALTEHSKYQVDHRIILKDGSYKAVHEQGEVELDLNGQPIKIIGTVLDVTSIKKMENLQELYQKVFESTLEGIAITDESAMVLYVNSAFTKITDYPEQDVLGKNINLLKSNTHSVEFYQKLWKDLTQEGQWQGEIWNRRKTGEIYPEWLTITKVHDPFTEGIQYVAVFYDLTDIKRKDELVEYKTNYDGLTDLPNRTLFKERLEKAILGANKNKIMTGVIMLNIDRFQNINESFGYNVGDKMLKMISKRLENIPDKKVTLSRWGGDEFIYLLEEIQNIHEAIGFTRQIFDKFKEPFHHEEFEIFITFSAGVTVYPYDNSDAENLIKNADIAKIKARSLGGDNHQLFMSSMNQKTQERIKLESDLRNALNKNELEIYYQPKVGLSSGKIMSSEALLRWNHFSQGMISPGFFIPLAEESGLIMEMGNWVIQDVCKQIRSWLDAGLYNIPVAINLSARQFQNSDLVENIKQIQDEYRLENQHLEFEVTESLVMQEMDKTIEMLKQLRSKGYLIAMDDFGTGYSSLSYLKNFPIDILKIDQSFIKNISNNQKDADIAKIIIEIGHTLDLKIVAEGVETKEQLQFLKKHNCDLIQGFYFSKPLPAKEYTQLLLSAKQLDNE